MADEAPRRILLASHDTEGARAAEVVALARAMAAGAGLHVLVVVPEFWQGMCGDDWLNNAATRDRFGKYVESELEREIRAHAERLHGEAKAVGVTLSVEVRQGDPATCLLEAARAAPADLVVIGAPRPKGRSGYRSRMKVETLVQGLGQPLLVVPHPAR